MGKDLLGRNVELSEGETPIQKEVSKIKFILKAGWMFNHPIEKIILVIIFTWSIYSFIKYILL